MNKYYVKLSQKEEVGEQELPQRHEEIKIDISEKPFNSRNLYNKELMENEVAKYIKRHNEAIKLLSTATVDSNLPKIVLASFIKAGMGNRLPNMMCAIIYALLSEDRIVLIDYNALNLHKFPMEVDYSKFRHLYAQKDVVSLHDDWAVTLNTNLTERYKDNAIVEVKSLDFHCAPIYVNPHYHKRLLAMIPDGDMFHAFADYFLIWNDELTSKVQKNYEAIMGPNPEAKFMIGVQMRLKRLQIAGVDTFVQRFCDVAESIAVSQRKPVVFYVAGDSNKNRNEFRECFKGRDDFPVPFQIEEYKVNMDQVDWVGNPGTTDFDALVDMLMLSKCSALAITFMSTYGATAAAVGGVKNQFYVMPNSKFVDDRVSFWGATSSEPCFYKSKLLMNRASEADKSLFMKHPHNLHHLQCSLLFEE